MLVGFLGLSALFAWLLSRAASPGEVLLFGALLAFFNLGAWGAIYAYTPELFPTALRGSGAGFVAAVGRVGGSSPPTPPGPSFPFGARAGSWPSTGASSPRRGLRLRRGGGDPREALGGSMRVALTIAGSDSGAGRGCRRTSRSSSASGSTGRAPSPWSPPRTPWGCSGCTSFPRGGLRPDRERGPGLPPSRRQDGGLGGRGHRGGRGRGGAALRGPALGGGPGDGGEKRGPPPRQGGGGRPQGEAFPLGGPRHPEPPPGRSPPGAPHPYP